MYTTKKIKSAQGKVVYFEITERKSMVERFLMEK